MTTTPDSWLRQIASDAVLDLAYCWLCKRRATTSHNNEVWFLRSRWAEVKPRLQRDLLLARYRLSPTRRIHIEGEVLEIWSAEDALVLKAVSIVLSRELHGELSPRCFHLVGRGGAKAAVREVAAALPDNRFVFRTDVKSYYASIDHDCLLAQVRRLVPVADVVDLIEQYIQRTVNDGGLYEDVTRGICLGCSLSPLMGAIYLRPIDEAMGANGLFYARFMDDWVILAPSRWKLRRAIRTVNQLLAELKIEQHPDKTSIGPIDRGFDFLGYHLTRGGLRAATVTIEKSFAHVRRLYEQGADPIRIGQYVQRWRKWITSGLGRLSVTCDDVAVGCSRPSRSRRMPAC